MDGRDFNEPPTPDQVRSFYETLPEIYAPDDRWLAITRRWIRTFIEDELASVQYAPWSCLNLGSGGESYGIPESALVHVDVHPMRFSPQQNLVIADIQQLPTLEERMRSCLCVGSVINHCDAAAVIAGASRALAVGGRFILEFETSASLELILSRHFRRPATVINTFYQDRTIRLWAYSERYVRSLLSASGFAVTRRSSRHHLSPLAYLVSRNSNFAARFHVLDGIARRIPGVRTFASHVIYTCRRVS